MTLKGLVLLMKIKIMIRRFSYSRFYFHLTLFTTQWEQLMRMQFRIWALSLISQSNSELRMMLSGNATLMKFKNTSLDFYGLLGIFHFDWKMSSKMQLTQRNTLKTVLVNKKVLLRRLKQEIEFEDLSSISSKKETAQL